MYIIKYNEGIYAGTYNDMDGIYCFPSTISNKKKPKTFKTANGAYRHLTKLKNSIIYGNDNNQYYFEIIEWSENEYIKHLKDIGMSDKEIRYFTSRLVKKVNIYRNHDLELKNRCKRIFKTLKNEEIEVIDIMIAKNVCTISYLMPYCASPDEYSFQTDSDDESIIDGFCEAVEERANEMIFMIRECTDIKNLLKKGIRK